MSSDSESDEGFVTLKSRGRYRKRNDAFLTLEFLEAVRNGNLRKVKRMINTEGASVNTNDEDGNTALHIAAEKNNVVIIDFLLAQDKVMINAKNFRGQTPIYQAVQRGCFQSTDRLIQAGADIDYLYSGDETLLHIAVAFPKVAHLLVLKGANIEATSEWGSTPLDYAMDLSCLDSIFMLLYHNADVNTGSPYLTPFMTAIIKKQFEIQEVLLDYVADFNKSADYLGNTLSLALTYNSPFVAEIIKRGAEVNYFTADRAGRIDSPFKVCLDVPNHHNFKLIWDRLSFEDNFAEYHLCDMFHCLDQDNLEKYIDIIIESNNIDTAVYCFSFYNNFFLFINRFAKNKLNIDQLTKLICRLSLYNYRMTSYDIYAVYYNYGYCKLFKMLRYMEINDKRGWRPYMILPRLIFDPNCKFSNLVDVVLKIDKSDVLKLLQYFNYPPLMQALKLKYKDDQNMTQVIGEFPNVPSLKELARDKAREHIAKTFNTTNACQFYTRINNLDINNVYKEILTFERKVYLLDCQHYNFLR